MSRIQDLERELELAKQLLETYRFIDEVQERMSERTRQDIRRATEPFIQPLPPTCPGPCPHEPFRRTTTTPDSVPDKWPGAGTDPVWSGGIKVVTVGDGMGADKAEEAGE